MTERRRVGLKFWMARVVQECRRVSREFDADAVHDLRVALRRCRSMADGLMAFDPHPAWREMRREGKKLFSRLGALRDTQVMRDWVQRLSATGDAAAGTLTDHLAGEERRLKALALDGLQNFDPGDWLSRSSELVSRAARIPMGSPAFQHMALERWQEARQLHHLALRDRSQIAFHRLRVGLKRFRYTIENFLPARLHEWDADLRELQDLLGETHDLHVLWQTAIRIGVLRDKATRARWRNRIAQERDLRLSRYRQMMCGPNSLWRIWRAGLPVRERVRPAAFERLKVWAAFRDPDIAHSRHVAGLALQLFMGLGGDTPFGEARAEDARFILEAAALMHDVGRCQDGKEHHKASGRMIRKLDPPLGLDLEQLHLAALVARYHRGALPRPAQGRLAGLASEQVRLVTFLAGVLRLANAFDLAHDGHIRSLEVQRGSEVVLIRAQGYTRDDPLAPNLACARHLLEATISLPIYIQTE